MDIVNYGLYNIKDSYFKKFNSEYFCDNKSENRPYYLSLIDKDDIIWLIPLSSQVDNYKLKIESDINKNGKCLFYHIGKIHGIDRVFLIGNMFPITQNYILKEYTYSNVHYVVKNNMLIKEIKKRSSKYLALVQQGKLKPKIDIVSIKEKLLKDNSYICQ